MGKDSAPDPPDYSGIAAASEKSAQLSFQVAEDNLNWAKEQFKQNSAVTNSVVDSALGQMEQSGQWAAEDRARYEQIYQPLEEQQAYDAQNWASPERKEANAGAAEADVAQQFESSRNAAQQKLEQFGVDPSQVRQGALDAQSRFAEAAARAGAGNTSRRADDAMQQQLIANAVNTGKGYPSQYTAQQGVESNAGNQAVNSGLATTQSGSNTMGSPTTWQGLGNSALGTWSNALNMGFQNQLSSYNANQQSSSGIGGILGDVLGFGMSKIPGLAAGGPAAPIGQGGRAIPVPHDGFSVPTQASPSSGTVTDDVPANLNVGEFVIPKDVVSWMGEQGLQKLIMKSRQQAQQAPAQGQPQAPAPGPPRIQTAIPVGA